jgi:diguanylate cyclase (GGDEF)-like protein
MKLETPDQSDHEIFRQSIAELDRLLTSGWRSTIAEIATVGAAMAAPFVLGSIGPVNHLEVVLVVDAFLALLLVFHKYELSRHERTKLVRDRLSAQLKVAVKQRIQAEKLYDLSILDPLTGLHNRRFGEQRLKEEIERSERSGDPLAVILFDLDYFKEINDQFGHATGDLALKEFSRKLKRAVRACDIPVRMGGDEFLVVLPECPREKVDVILARIGSPQIRFNNQQISVCYSVGRAHHQVCDTAESMLGRADEVLYAEKAGRRNRAGSLPQYVQQPIANETKHELEVLTDREATRPKFAGFKPA